jgi:hypothetical protein
MEEEKKETEVAEHTKEELFKENPDDFIHVSDLVMAIKKHDDANFSVLLNTYKPSEMGGMIFMLLRHCLKTLDAIDFQRYQEKQQASKITAEVNKRGFRNFIHKGK